MVNKAKAPETNAQMEKRWRAESDLRTLVEARKIKADPARLKAATDLAKQQMTEVAAVAGDSDD